MVASRGLLPQSAEAEVFVERISVARMKSECGMGFESRAGFPNLWIPHPPLRTALLACFLLQNLARIPGEWSGFTSWLSRPMVRIRVLELDRNRPISVG